MPIIKKLINQTAIYGISSVFGRLINVLLVPLYTYLFTQEEYGIVAEFYAYVAFVMIVATYGMETAFFRFSETYDKKKVHSTSLFSLLITSTLFLIGFWVFSERISSLIGYPNYTVYIKWIALIVFFDTLTVIPFARLREQQKAIPFAVIKTLNILTNISLNLIFIVWLNKIDIKYIFLSNLIASGVTLALLSFDYKNTFKHMDFDIWKRMIGFSFPLIFAGLAGMINETIDTIMLKHLLPKDIAIAHVGIYRACYKIPIFLMLFIQAFRLGAEPLFFKQAIQKNAKKTYANIMHFFVITSLFLVIAIIFYIDFVKYFIGEDFREGLHVVPILLFANLMFGLYYTHSIWYKITNNTQIGAFISITGALITIVLNYFLIPKIGYTGSAWATLTCYSSMLFISYLWSRKHYLIPYNFISLTFYFTITLLLFFINKHFTNDNMLYNTLLMVIFATIILLKEKNFFKKLNES